MQLPRLINKPYLPICTLNGVCTTLHWSFKTEKFTLRTGNPDGSKTIVEYSPEQVVGFMNRHNEMCMNLNLFHDVAPDFAYETFAYGVNVDKGMPWKMAQQAGAEIDIPELPLTLDVINLSVVLPEVLAVRKAAIDGQAGYSVGAGSRGGHFGGARGCGGHFGGTGG
ncbi:hypothetical protein EST38_g9294 [Candolleomyces aberdarensis]|uniref:Uncharacterized protein n=1 Tax=Candolleomyces aberdarensis TaxID=2316362 RepID=A0A4Q2DCL9_9AGAR|nr:hypothetical protein EST38_g9294 [Candolleomyces aberdarensis]